MSQLQAMNERDITVSYHSTAYCPDDNTDGLLGYYEWTERAAERTQTLPCVFNGTLSSGSCNISRTLATRLCNEYGKWAEPDLTYCLSEVTANLCFIRDVSVP